MSDSQWPPPSPFSNYSVAPRPTQPSALTVLAVMAAQPGWAFVIALLVAATDDVPADDYSASSRGAIGFLMVFLAIALPVGAGLVYAIARVLHARQGVAIAIAQLPALAAMVLILIMW